MARRIRKDATLKTVSKKTGIPEKSFRNPDGRKTRKDARVKTIRKRHR